MTLERRGERSAGGRFSPTQGDIVAAPVSAAVFRVARQKSTCFTGTALTPAAGVGWTEGVWLKPWLAAAGTARQRMRFLAMMGDSRLQYTAGTSRGLNPPEVTAAPGVRGEG